MDLPVIVGTTHTDAQMMVFLSRDASGMYVFRVMVSSVMMAMARMEKSAAYITISGQFPFRNLMLCYGSPVPTTAPPSH
jgi:hypothetical protein